MSDFIPSKDYKLVDFTKKDTETIKRIKDYSVRNCRKLINKSYITQTLDNFDYGLAYFRSERLKINNSIKNRPCAFACVKYEENDILYLSLIYSIQNNDSLGTKILNEVFSFAKHKGSKLISLECDETNINFYKKFNFIEKGLNKDDMMTMTKYIN